MEGVRSTIKLGDQSLPFGDVADVQGEVSSLLAADGKLFAVTLDGRIYCFSSATTRDPITYPQLHTPIKSDASPLTNRVRQIVNMTRGHRGYAVIRDARSLEWLVQLLDHTEMKFIVAEPDERRAARWRRQLDDRGLYGQRIGLHVADPASFQVPPYFASFELVDSTESADRIANQATAELRDFQSLRPYGGAAMLSCSAEARAKLRAAVSRTDRDSFMVERHGTWTVVRRQGALVGAVNYTGGWASPDAHLRAPLGVLWFDDTLGHFKRSPQPWFVDGVMISLPKDWLEIHRTGRRPPYDLLPPIVSDVYTGRIIERGDAILKQVELPQRNVAGAQPNQYRPPTQSDAWKPKQPIVGERINPLTRETEPRAIPKSYGCDGGVDYGNFFTMRSGTPAFYDKRLESGVCNISGPRSGCTNSIIPACGILNVPYFYEGCTCSYPLPAGLAMVNMPADHEQWASWGPASGENIERVGINLGAPGDRMTEEGTLWLEHPTRGGASPDVRVSVEPDSASYFYQHSVWMQGGQGWPWVAASGVEGASAVTISGLKPGHFTVRLHFAERNATSMLRKFDITINDQAAVASMNVYESAGGPMRSVVREVRAVEVGGEVRVALDSLTGETLLCGIELIRETE